MSELARRQCVPCRGGVPPLPASRISELLQQLDGWQAVDGHHLVREWTLPDFAQALAMVNRFGAIAEEQAHHPDLTLAWGKVGARIWTHKIDGLTESDFILAARLDQAAREWTA